jgi:predicted O-methyltransferase YrrM
MFGRLPAAVEAVKVAYDPSTGCYRREDGTLDSGHTEIETLETWRGLLLCLKPKIVVETGVYKGLSTCYIASALRDSGVSEAKVYSIDPWTDIEHYWDGTDLASFIEFVPHTSQDAAPLIAHLTIDVLVIDSIHTYAQSSWELMTFEPQVREGGFIIMHDSIFFDGVGRTAHHLYDNPRFEAITFDTPRTANVPTVSTPVPMGCTIARKIRHGAPISRDPAWLSVPEKIPEGPLAFIRHRALEISGA